MNKINSLLENAKKLNINLTQNQINQFNLYYDFLIQQNSYINLTTITSEEDVINKHFIDSMLISNYITSNKTILDIGTGAGFPGLVLAIISPKNKFILLDNDRTKIIFLKRLVHLLKLTNVDIVFSNVNIYIKPPYIDYIVTRAFTDIDDFLKICTRLLKKDTYVIYSSSKELNINNQLYKIVDKKSYDLIYGKRVNTLIKKIK